MKGVIDYKNIYEMLKKTYKENPGKTGFRWVLNDHGDMGSVTWKEFHEQTLAVSKGLIKLGVKKGDRVAIVSYTSYKWVLCDIGSVSIGASVVGIYHSLLADDCKYILNHSEAKVVFVEDEEQLQKILSIKKKIPFVEKVILLEGEYTGKVKNWVLSFEEFMDKGVTVKDSNLDKMIKSVKPGDIASIVYTSGTTGLYKGVMLTHDNIIFTSQIINKFMPVQETDETLLFLPMAHIFARLDMYTTIFSNITLSFCRSIETVVDDLQIIRPHWFPSVPRVFEKIFIRIRDGVEEKGGVVKLLFNRALKTGYRVSRLQLENKKIPPLLALRYRVAMKLVFKKIHEALGGRVRFCVSGAAPMNPEVTRFFHAAGLIILEGYGMTENTSFTNCTTVDDIKFGSVGHHAPEIEQKIADNGEILFRGRNVMKGYYKMSKETKETITKDGWLHTGDIGFVDSQGRLTITGRLKDIIITSGGKNIAPSRIESFLGTSKFINQVCVVGDSRKYLAALVTLNADNVVKFAKKRNIQFEHVDDLNNNEEVRGLIHEEVNKANEKLASFETIKRFAIVPEFTIESGLLTPTMKPKRNEVMKRYEKEIDSLYE